MPASLVLVPESSKSYEVQHLLAVACSTTGRVHVAIPGKNHAVLRICSFQLQPIGIAKW
jgi:hypothetical protein